MTQASGAVFKLRRGLFAENPVVDDGGVIYVSEKPAEVAGTGPSVGEVVQNVLAIAASAVTVIVPIIVAINR